MKSIALEYLNGDTRGRLDKTEAAPHVRLPDYRESVHPDDAAIFKERLTRNLVKHDPPRDVARFMGALIEAWFQGHPDLWGLRKAIMAILMVDKRRFEQLRKKSEFFFSTNVYKGENDIGGVF